MYSACAFLNISHAFKLGVSKVLRISREAHLLKNVTMYLMVCLMVLILVIGFFFVF